ncbi:MAG: alpha-1,4-glucan--maltose-1-phosphate maltosyltransferase, partial [Actinobacteria bacterium]|nr:alpha-1,4-glucan--maltose-1-phosphate maltosyltransferase [Actinomycetota bacterium]
VYFPPIHPIGRTGRKGRNNKPEARRTDPGSPWAIGAKEGGHTAVHPDLGTLADFDRLVATAKELGLEIALDFAIQCSPDHPWITEHPEWFKWRPDGTIKFAENPPKRYQDIVNVDFDSEDWRGLWEALRDVVLFWIGHGVRVFRVDNPHTKPLPFWEWLLGEIRSEYPDTIFLAEAFTQPAMMRALAKVGFNQSYTYFTWKNSRRELEEYVTELATETVDYLRPNFFANTPDILHAYLQTGGRPAFEARLVLAATLSPTYGIYSGYESCENIPVRPGSEEYMDSEKYEVKQRKLDGPLLPLIRRLNEIRRANRSLQHVDNITFLDTANEYLIAYAKRSLEDTLIVVVNLDPHAPREGLATVPGQLGLPAAFTVQDLLTDSSYAWRTGGNYVLLGPGRAHVLHVK